MNITYNLAQAFRSVFLRGNWTDVNFKSELKDITWQQATRTLESCNTIATLIYHIDYYTNSVLHVLKKNALSGKHKESFNCPEIKNEKDWHQLQDKLWETVKNFSDSVEALSEEQLWQTFEDEKYGNYYRNIQGITELAHYHLGQIVLLKKII